MNKKGIQLSVNFLVVIILGLVILGLGTSLFYKLISTSKDIVLDVDKQTEERLERMMQTGGLVVISDVTKNIKAGEFADFYLGITNEHSILEEFNIIVTESDPDPPLLGELVNIHGGQIVFLDQPYEVEVNDNVIIPIRIVTQKKTPKGTFIFLIEVEDGTLALYGSKQQIIVNVNK